MTQQSLVRGCYDKAQSPDPALWLQGHVGRADCSVFPPHSTYLEPFCGSCAVLFAKPRCKNEMINDSDKRLINAYQMLVSRPKELAAVLWCG